MLEVIQKDTEKRTLVEWNEAIRNSKRHEIGKTIEVSINSPYPETKLDKTIKRIDESQKFDSMLRISFDDFFERHTRSELAYIAHEIINYLEDTSDDME